MESNHYQAHRSPKAIGTRKRPKRDGYKVCSVCNANVGLRAKLCTACKTPFPTKEKDWPAIERHASTMKETYIKDKIFDRMDQLATKSGWTGIVFLVHENPESRCGQKRIFQHSYSTKGAGKKIEEAMRVKVFKAMKNFLYGDVIEEDNGIGSFETDTSSSASASQEVGTTMPSHAQSEAPLVNTSASSASLSPHIPSFSTGNVCPSSTSESLSSSSCTPSLSSNATAALSTKASPLPASISVSEPSVSASPYTSSSFLTPSHSNHPATSGNLFPPATGSALNSCATPSPSFIENLSSSVSNSSPTSPAGHLSSSSTSHRSFHSSVSSHVMNPSSAASLPPSHSISHLVSSTSNRQGHIMELNGKRYFVMNVLKSKQ